MNIRRGMFRLWIVMTVIYGIIVCAVTYEQWSRDLYENAYLFPKGPGQAFTYVSSYSADLSNTYALDFPNRVKLYVPVGISAEIVDKQRPKFMADHVQPRAKELGDQRSEALVNGAVGLFVPPLVVLALGAAIAWALSGFRRAV